MVLWVDKYRPTVLGKLNLHVGVNGTLSKLVSEDAHLFPHLLFYGPPGGGKKTRVMAVLRALYGRGVDKVKVSNETIKTKSKSVDVYTLSSNYHVELNPSTCGNSDRIVIQQIIADLASTQNVASAVTAAPSSSSFSSSSTNDDAGDGVSGARSFKIVILTEVDKLTLAAQHALRRTMEKYMTSCRLILVSDSLCRVIAPLRSRCLPIRVPAASPAEITDILTEIASKEHLKVSPDITAQIVNDCGRNIRRAILMLEATKVKNPQLMNNAPQSTKEDGLISIGKNDWELFIDHVGKLICEEQSAPRLMVVRQKFYELLANCIPPYIIIKHLVDSLLRRVDDSMKHEIIMTAAFYDHRLHEGSKPIVHLEAFVAKFMALYKRWVLETFG